MTSKVLSPDPVMFEHAAEVASVRLVEFSRRLERLEPDDFLPRFNRIVIEIEIRDDYPHDLLLLNVKRTGSEIGDDNFYTFPIQTRGLDIGTCYRVEFLHFDAFNLAFEGMRVTIMTREEYHSRQVNENFVRSAARQVRKVCPV